MLDHDLARECGGRLLLRIEDIDVERCRPDYEAAIFEDLSWLGISWPEPVRRQSGHFDDYATAIADCKRRGCLGNHYVLTGLGFRREFYRMPVVGSKVYWGGWYEAGTAFNDPSSFVVHSSFNAGVIADTLFGPITLSGAVSPTGRTRSISPSAGSSNV